MLIGSCAGVFYAFDSNTGQIRWSYDIKKDGDQTSFHGNPLITDDLIIIGTDGGRGGAGEGVGHVYAFERSSGNVRWKHKLTRGLPGGFGVPTNIVRSGSSIYGVAFGDELLCLDLGSGRLKWSFSSGFSKREFQWSQSPVVAAGLVIFGGIDGIVYALNPETGKSVWKREISARISTHLAVADNSIYFGAANNYLYRLDARTGSVLAEFKAEAIPVGTITFAKDSLFVFLNSHGGAGGAQTLVCLDDELTKARWSQAGQWSLTRAQVWQGDVLAGNESGEIFAYRTSDGSRQWSHKFKGVIRSIGSSDKTLYIGTLNGTIYAYQPR